mmetsp:Transcript_13786/g.32750  ORF Transcript_13786/g.32750 Transcript_13786/m.32750 type:complete len:1450 (+) Transcript_13786:266-4615(+)
MRYHGVWAVIFAVLLLASEVQAVRLSGGRLSGRLSEEAAAEIDEAVAAHEEEHGGGGHASGAEVVMLFLFVCLVVGCACRFLLEELLHTFHIRIPYSVVLLLIGGTWGAGAWKHANDNGGEASEMATMSLLMWSSIDPKLILFIFLPALIFEGSMGTNYYAFSSGFGGGIMLAGPGMLLQNTLIACFAKYAFPYGWGWLESFIFGAILSATDPVAVIALLKELGILPDLRILIEAESLLNDGTAIVVFDICLMALLEPTSISEYVQKGFQLVFGAPALGLALFIPCYYWLKRTTDPIQDTVVTMCTAYLCYFVAEGTQVHVSGVLSVLTVGVLMAGYGHTCLNTEEAAHMLHAVWTIIVYCAETIIFVLAGAIIMDKGFLGDDADSLPASEYGWMFLNYVVCTFIRALVVFIFSPFIRQVGYGLQPRVCSMSDFIKNMFVLTWGGLRGAVGLVLALSVSVNTELELVTSAGYTRKVLLHTASIVVLTTLVNAATLEKIIHMLGLGGQSEAEKVLFESAKTFLGEKQLKTMENLQNQLMHPELSNASWSTVRRLVGRHALMGPTGASGDVPGEDKKKEKEDEKDEETNPEEWPGPDAERPGGLGGSMEDVLQEEEDTEGYVLGRYLTSLKASYTAQWNGGLLTSRPYRQLVWALGRAMDHAQDRFPEGEMSLDENGVQSPMRRGGGASLIRKKERDESPYAKVSANAVAPVPGNGVTPAGAGGSPKNGGGSPNNGGTKSPSGGRNKVTPMTALEEGSEEEEEIELPPDAGAADGGEEGGGADDVRTLEGGDGIGENKDGEEENRRVTSNREDMLNSPEWDKDEDQVKEAEKEEKKGEGEGGGMSEAEAAANNMNLVSMAPQQRGNRVDALSPLRASNAGPRGGGSKVMSPLGPGASQGGGSGNLKSRWAGLAGQDLANRFEWDWLEVEGCFEMPRWLEYVKKVPLLGRWCEGIERQLLAERFDLIAAVVRAHEETGRAEVLQHNTVSEFFQLVIEASQYVRDTAEHKLAEMEVEMPEVATACRTRQACRLMINGFREEVDALHDIAQITDGEHERLQNRIYNKMMKMNRNYPKIHAHHRELYTLPIFMSIPRIHLENVAEQIQLTQEVVPRELQITVEGEPTSGVYIIVRGVVRWTRSGQVNAIENRWATPFSSINNSVGASFDSAAVGMQSTAPVVGHIAHASPSTDTLRSVSSGPPGTDGENKSRRPRRRRQSVVELPLTQGSAFHDTEYLLHFAGLPSINRGSAVTVTEVHMYHLTTEHMSTLIARFPAILERMWRHSGLLLHASHPQLFAIPDDFSADFTRVKVKKFDKDTVMRVWLPTLIIQGSAVVSGGAGVITGERGPGMQGGGLFQLVRREDGENLKFCQDENRVLVFTPTQETIIHRRGAEMQSHAKSSRRIISEDEVMAKNKGKLATKWDQVRSASRAKSDLSLMLQHALAPPPNDRQNA